MSKPKHSLSNKANKKNLKQVRSGLIEGDTPKASAPKMSKAKVTSSSKKRVHRQERRVAGRTPHADDGTWSKVGESKLLSKAQSFTKNLVKQSVKKINKFFKPKSTRK